MLAQAVKMLARLEQSKGKLEFMGQVTCGLPGTVRDDG